MESLSFCRPRSAAGAALLASLSVLMMSENSSAADPAEPRLPVPMPGTYAMGERVTSLQSIAGGVCPANVGETYVGYLVISSRASDGPTEVVLAARGSDIAFRKSRLPPLPVNGTDWTGPVRSGTGSADELKRFEFHFGAVYTDGFDGTAVRWLRVSATGVCLVKTEMAFARLPSR